MPEMPHPRQHHRDLPAASAAAITSASRIEPPGWITAVAPAATEASSPSAKGKNASEAATLPCVRGSQPCGGVPRFSARSAPNSDAAHLPGADAYRRLVLGVDDGVGLHMLGHTEGENQVFITPPSVRAW